MDTVPSISTLQRLCPDIEQSVLEEHINRLPEKYFHSFSAGEIRDHLYYINTLSPDQPCICRIDELEDGRISCTVFSFDYPSVFSIITGLLAATGFNILSGNIFTYARSVSKDRIKPGQLRRYKSSIQPQTTKKDRRMIIDTFTGTTTGTTSIEQWSSHFRTRLRQLLMLIEQHPQDGVAQAREQVQEMVVNALIQQQLEYRAVLYPVHIEEIATTENKTRMKVKSEDTPFFLYSLSNALALHNISIERVTIRTIDSRVEDEFEFVDLLGKPVNDPVRMNKIRLSILFTKQFTYFLGRAPDPHRALLRFETIIQDIFKLSESGNQAEILSDPRILKDLARLLGASDFLWEDFLRLQYESILPMLHEDNRRLLFSHTSEENRTIVRDRLQQVTGLEEAKQELNDFKDREIYLIDLDHILNPDIDFLQLSKKLTDLAELVVNTAVSLSLDHYISLYGTPQTVAGLPATYTVLGLGKLGGAALGYASDIELMFIYSDNGRTSGEPSIPNAEFFERMFKESVQLIEAKRQGIFKVDLRLRPFGNAGPLACSLETFCTYYGQRGQAHSFERLSLIRMRAIGGDKALGAQIERLRDEMVYATDSIDRKELRQLREKQLEEKTRPGKLNAKFSPGALVDLEYTVQILQCIYGKDNAELRTPRIHIALKKLQEAGVLRELEADEIVEAYHFFRRLLNGLRMLRGSAEDLFLPDVNSDEFMHLARRTGYTWRHGFSPAQIVYSEFESRTASIRRFIEEHLGREAIPGKPAGNAADMVLSDTLPKTTQDSILVDGGFQNKTRAKENLLILAGEGEQKTLFAHLAVLAWDILRTTPDPDMALNNWERFVHAIPNAEVHYQELLSQPKRLEILLQIFAGSQFLSDTLVKNPDFFEWVTTPQRINSMRLKADVASDLESLSETCPDRKTWLNSLRIFRKREILRVGTRDICLKVPPQDIFQELSTVADAIIGCTLRRIIAEICRPEERSRLRFCILAFGKLGGTELNYSSDIDLLGIYDLSPFPETEREGMREKVKKIMERIRADLSAYTEEGYVYRVDLRLRPFGRSGTLTFSVDALLSYYANAASLWEYQALLKLRPVAGDFVTGEHFLEQVRPLLQQEWDSRQIKRSIRHHREHAQKTLGMGITTGYDIKAGVGGIRDIEFLVQGLQLMHCREYPGLLIGNTLKSIDVLAKHNILPADTAATLKTHYLYLRRVEHFLQIFEDRQIHATPTNGEQRIALSKRLQGSGDDPDRFFETLEQTLSEVKEIHDHFLSA